MNCIKTMSLSILAVSVSLKSFCEIRPEKKSSDPKKYGTQSIGGAVHRVRCQGGRNCDGDTWSAAFTIFTTKEAGVHVVEKSGVVSSHCFSRYEMGEKVKIMTMVS